MADARAVPGTATLVLRSEGIGSCSNIVVKAIQSSLDIFLTDFINTDEGLDDRWYHNALLELLYDPDGDVETGNFLNEEEARSFSKDPIGHRLDYHHSVRKRFEDLIVDNRPDIDATYLLLNITSVLSKVNKDNIVVIIGGTLL